MFHFQVMLLKGQLDLFLSLPPPLTLAYADLIDATWSHAGEGKMPGMAGAMMKHSEPCHRTPVGEKSESTQFSSSYTESVTRSPTYVPTKKPSHLEATLTLIPRLVPGGHSSEVPSLENNHSCQSCELLLTCVSSQTTQKRRHPDSRSAVERS